MARRPPPPGTGRLAAVLDPQPPVRGLPPAARGPARAPEGDAPTTPLPRIRPGAAHPATADRTAPAGRPGRIGAVLGRWLPQSWRGARTDPGRPGAVALVVVAAVAAVLAGVAVWSQRPQVEPVSALPAISVAPEPAAPAGPPVSSPPAPSASAPPEPLVVSVAGKVARPGIVRVPEGARVADVLDAAGGPLPGADLSGLNLARRVGDGEQVAVGVPPAPDAAGGRPRDRPGAGGGAAAPGPGQAVDLNSATLEQLDGLPGVGPVTAQRILEWRERNGRFVTVDQLREVEGIGERRFEQLRALVRV